MANVTLSELRTNNPANTLTGTEPIETVQSGVSVATTTQDIANLAAPTYKVYSALVDNFLGTFSAIVLKNDFIGTTFSFSSPSSGVIALTSSSNVMTVDKTIIQGSSLNSLGVPYFLTGYRNAANVCNFDVIKYDGTQVSTPNFSQVFFEVRVYN